MLTADERAQIRADLDPAQQAERWRSLALRLLDELEAAENFPAHVTWEVLSGQLDAEKERADRLQRENETMRAALESLEPVGWMLNFDDDPDAHKPYWFWSDVPTGTKRRMYLAPQQPLEDAQ